MLSPSDTAYRVLTASASAHELDNAFTPDLVELAFAERHTRRPASLVGLLLLLKTFQRIGYFVPLSDIPASVVRQVSRVAGFANVPDELSSYDSSTTRREHMALVRSYIGVTAFDRDAQKLMLKACVEAARSREDLADIINSAIEELLRNYRELPAFSTLLRGARRARSTVNLGYYGRIARSLDEVAKKRFASLLERKAQDRRTDWDALKMEPGRPTVKRIRRFLQHLDWLKELAAGLNPFSEIPVVKLQRFAAEARALNAARMGEVMENKRHALAAALLDRQLRRAFDDGGDMVIRVVQKMHNTAKELLEAKRVVYLQQATELVTTLREVALAYSQNAPAEERLNAIGAGLGADPEKVVKRCDEHSALVGGDHLRFLPDAFRHPRTALLLLLEKLEIASTTSDKRLENAISFIVAHKARPTGALAVARQEKAKDGSLQHVPILDLSFVPDRWWRLVTGLKNRDVVPTHVDHRLLELCVITEVANELKSCDLCLPRGDKFRDYRNQLVSPEQYEREVPIYSERMGIAVTGPEFVANLQRELEEMAQKADAGFPDNKHLRIENGEPVLTAAGARPDPAGLREFESLLKRHMEPVEILDALVDTEHWLNWTRFFGPLSGLDTKLKNARVRYLLTTFCFGSAMGPAQTARCVVGANRFQLAFINQRHVTEANLNDAITLVINAYVQFPLQRLWGLGRSASADGMKWDLYPQNLVAEYHIRYGGYGGIGYYLLSDCYIALVSRFTTCGSWEGHYILDFLKENQSDIQPDTVHADTQGQSEAIFGLAYLLGIQLQPRIRNWKGLHFYHTDPAGRYEHIGSLFSGEVDMELIKTMLPEMLRVAVSVKTGAILPSDILRRLGSYSRKNKLYYAFRELGRLMRTIFLLRYISEVELRQVIHAATTKSERFNLFVQWVAFGGDRTIAENVRDEQRKFIKYNHLLANLLVFHNVVTMTKAIQRVEGEGHPVGDDVLASLSPFATEHINRFGKHVLNFSRNPRSVERDFRKRPGKEISILRTPGVRQMGDTRN